jgi:hypothetical protein
MTYKYAYIHYDYSLFHVHLGEDKFYITEIMHYEFW